ncbi:ATP-binding protein [Frankia sp. AgB1.9]|uniref:ATP-binding protein n=1 Tax=unclassified Frankia TaxID=2632575 RepID=UPI001933098D|nr:MULTISPECIES: ATP-binding protein [unclassified Frankia]MBL7491907.1 ATP-binding protein [Frankia sp. AgW1.1]MBL7550196.1 ATP-binding protein [Frankia sp. AgB1.9]MBL7619855.1 ATP-binding protein [Frankia sp. AgB1.8]
MSTTATAPGIARAQVAATLAEWQLEPLADDARLVASELTCNAVNAATAPGLDPDDRFLRFIGLRLTETAQRLFIEVFDVAPGLPTLRPTEELAEGGHGLHLVAAVADWGVYATKGSAGKVVWASLRPRRRTRRDRSRPGPAAETQPGHARCSTDGARGCGGFGSVPGGPARAHVSQRLWPGSQAG